MISEGIQNQKSGNIINEPSGHGRHNLASARNITLIMQCRLRRVEFGGDCVKFAVRHGHSSPPNPLWPTKAERNWQITARCGTAAADVNVKGDDRVDLQFPRRKDCLCVP